MSHLIIVQCSQFTCLYVLVHPTYFLTSQCSFAILSYFVDELVVTNFVRLQMASSASSTTASSLVQQKIGGVKINYRVSIIGTAGRKEDAPKLTLELYNAMIQCVPTILHHWGLSPNRVILVSGGAAGADHVAVRTYLDAFNEAHTAFAGLQLYLPCAWVDDTKDPRGYDTGTTDSRSNPGRLMNQLHKAFSTKCGINSLMDIRSAAILGGHLHTSSRGFHARNRLVAQCDYMIAFTWCNDTVPRPGGGTRHTWDTCKSAPTSNKIHVPLSLLIANKFTITPTIRFATSASGGQRQDVDEGKQTTPTATNVATTTVAVVGIGGSRTITPTTVTRVVASAPKKARGSSAVATDDE
jgi:hypothetical protein